VLLVTHALLSKCLLRALLRFEDTGITWRHALDETAVSELRYYAAERAWTLARWNDCSHLTGDLSPRYEGIR